MNIYKPIFAIMLYYMRACIIQALSVAAIGDVTPTISTFRTRQSQRGVSGGVINWRGRSQRGEGEGIVGGN